MLLEVGSFFAKNNGQKLEVFINNQKIGVKKLMNDWNLYQFNCPFDKTPPILKINFKLSQTLPFFQIFPDQRQLGIMVKRVKID